MRKPHPEIFRRTLEALGVDQRDALHVGDTPGSDVVGARGVGMGAVHLNRVKGGRAYPGEVRTIASLFELLPLIDSGLV